MPAGVWEVRAPTRILFGPGRFAELAEHVAGRRVLLVTTKGAVRRGWTGLVRQQMGERLVGVCDTVTPNPTVDQLETSARRWRGIEADAVLAVGGGSVLDSAKVLAGVLRSGGALGEALRRGCPAETGAELPVTAVPTTSGTGAEVTPFATVWDRVGRRKYSWSGPSVAPVTAVLDPRLTLGLGEAETIATGLDAVSHAMESVWNRNANPVSLALARESLRLSLRALPEVLRSPGDLASRTQMSAASLLAGMAISLTRTALAHSMSYPLTLRYGVAHGVACSFALGAVLEYNATVDDGRLEETARSLGLANVAALQAAVHALLTATRARERIVSAAPTVEVLGLAEEMVTPGRSDNNMRPAGVEEIRLIVKQALGA